MSPLRSALADYLTVAAPSATSWSRSSACLGQFVAYLRGGAKTITTEDALAWATLPGGARALALHPALSRARLCRLPAGDRPRLRGAAGRAAACPQPARTPYIYSEREIAALMAAAGDAEHGAPGGDLPDADRLAGGERDADRRGDRASTARRRLRGAGCSSSGRRSSARPASCRFTDSTVSGAAPLPAPRRSAAAPTRAATRCSSRSRLSAELQRHGRRSDGSGPNRIRPRSAACRPRLHDLRHTFAVRTLLDAYREDGEVEARLAALSTYLGHVNPPTRTGTSRPPRS